MSRSPFWFLLILCLKSPKHYGSQKLKLTIPQSPNLETPKTLHTCPKGHKKNILQLILGMPTIKNPSSFYY